MQDIKLEIKKLIIETLNIDTVSPEEIKDDLSLLSGENVIKIDSIDVLEVIVAIQKKFNVRINNQNHARHIANSIDSIAEFINSQSPNME